jgi:hypothetical protein
MTKEKDERMEEMLELFLEPLINAKDTWANTEEVIHGISYGYRAGYKAAWVEVLKVIKEIDERKIL